MGSKSSRSPVRKYLAEGIIIVFSILLAFAIDAAWSNRVELNSVNDSLSAILVDFESAVREFDRSSEIHRQRKEAIEELTSFSNETLRNVPADSVLNLIWRTTLPTTIDPQMATLSGMIGSGQLSKVKNRELRSDLANWDGMFRDVNGTQTMLIREIMERLNPSLSAHVVITRIGPASPRFGSDYGGLFESREVQYNWNLVRVMSQGAIEEIALLKELTLNIIEEIRTELEMAA